VADSLAAPPEPHPTATLPYGLMMQRRGFNYAHLAKRADGSTALGAVVIDEASDNARKLSDLQRNLQTKWLTSR
jgi:hypothetical protein